jgi:hypothetical protein
MTEIAEQDDYKSVLIYPNPVSDVSRIAIPASASGKITLEVYNELGVLAKQSSGLASDQIEIRKCEFPAGLYFFQVTGSDSRLFSGKFVVN